MQPPIPRFVLWTVALAVIAALSVAVFQYWGRSQSQAAAAAANSWTQTQWGPVGPADRDLLIKVRQAGLWEGPTGQDAQQRGSSARVREVGQLISAEHADLDNRVRGVATRLGVALPNQPSDQQQAWIAEIASQSGSNLDRTFVQRLRAAHGNVLPVISQVRAGTRNDLVRQFATTAAEFVTRHHGYLESTGLVDFSALPEPPAPNAAPPATVPPAAAIPLRVTGDQALAGSAPAAAVVPAVADHSQHLDQVASITPVNGGQVMIAALVYIAALLAIVGLLSLLGTAGLRARRARVAPQRSLSEPARPRHAAQRW